MSAATSGAHRDTYLEEYHRHFFSNYARGLPPRKCGIAEKHISGLVGLIPIVVYFKDQPADARVAALEHLSLTHLGSRMEAAASLLIELLLQLFSGAPLTEAVTAEMERQENPLLGLPLLQWLDGPDEVVIGQRLSAACYVRIRSPPSSTLPSNTTTMLKGL